MKNKTPQEEKKEDRKKIHTTTTISVSLKENKQA